MKTKPVSAAPAQQLIRVRWDSGDEFIDVREFQQYRKGPIDQEVYTSEIRGDGQCVFYKPLLRWLNPDNADSFTLEYKDSGKLGSGMDAGGDLGLAVYFWKNNAWRCEWEYAGDEWTKVHRKCSLVDVGSAREFEMVWRAKRFQKFRALLLDHYKECAVTGETLECLLDAAHVNEVRDGGSDALANGLILRKDIHALFDARLLKIGPSGEFVFDDSVSSSYDALRHPPRKLSDHILSRIRSNLARRNQFAG